MEQESIERYNMLLDTKCSICGEKKRMIKCGSMRKISSNKSLERKTEYICVLCKRKGLEGFASCNHKQSEIYETMED